MKSCTIGAGLLLLILLFGLGACGDEGKSGDAAGSRSATAGSDDATKLQEAGANGAADPKEPASGSAGDETPTPAGDDGNVGMGASREAAPSESGTSDPAAGSGATTADPQADPITEAVASVLRDVISGKRDEDDRQELENQIISILERQEMGDPEGRRLASTFTVKLILDKKREMRGGGGTITPFQEQALKVLASELATDLYRKLPMKSGQRHEGVLLSVAKEVEMPAGYVKAPWAVLGGFEYREKMTLPENVRALDGKKVGIVGYMMTLEEVEDIHEFLLVESLWTCCFGTAPDIHQVILAIVPGDRGVDFTTAPVLLLGTLEVGEEYQDGFVTSLYRLRVEKMEEVE